jgi:hypothetical protein
MHAYCYRFLKCTIASPNAVLNNICIFYKIRGERVIEQVLVRQTHRKNYNTYHLHSLDIIGEDLEWIILAQ